MHIWFGPRSAWPFDYQSNFYSLHSSIRWYVLMISLKCICWPTLMIPRGHFACKRNQINSSIIVDFTWWKSHRRHSRTYNSILLKKTTTKWNILISCWNWSFVNWPATTRNIILRIQVLHKLKKKNNLLKFIFTFEIIPSIYSNACCSFLILLKMPSINNFENDSRRKYVCVSVNSFCFSAETPKCVKSIMERSVTSFLWIIPIL